MNGDASAWKNQQALERASSTHVMTAPVVQGGANVCVWDAFGEFWCENAAKKGAVVKKGATAGYVREVTKQGQALVYEGFCGCGADASM